MSRSSKARKGVTLVEIMVAAGLFAMIMTAVLSFYIEAAAVTAKRDEQSARLRRFHLGLEKMEQMLREGRVENVGARSVLFLKLSQESELDGFPLYEPAPAQLASTEEGVLLNQGGVEINLLPTEKGEHVIFSWVHENPANSGNAPAETLLNVALYYSGNGERSDLFFHRTINLQRY